MPLRVQIDPEKNGNSKFNYKPTVLELNTYEVFFFLKLVLK